ncbi:amino acid adenylation domain-containing protein [Tistrella sp. BH-R2-4]|uniref:Amino acid adenylation domain-containing protein n=1 Tax=Tistrella arctica TaxID=3133430 RepID=A0ABU9YQW1_9PROT
MSARERPAGADIRLPLATCQDDVLTDQRAHPGSAHQTIGGCCFLVGPLDIDRLVLALHRLMAEAVALRLVPDDADGQWLRGQVVPAVTVTDVSDAPDPDKRIRDDWQAMAARMITVEGRRPPWRVVISRAGPERHGVMALFHHAVMDGYGSSLFFQRWAAHYTAIDQGLPPPPLDDPGYERFIADSRAYATGPGIERDLDHWQRLFATLPPPLMADRAPPAVDAGHDAGRLPLASLVEMAVPRAVHDRAGGAVGVDGASRFHLYLAALAVVLAGQYGRDDLVIAVPTLNRPGRRYRQTLGLFAGLLPLRVTVAATDTPADLVARIGRGLRQAYRHRRVPLARLCGRLDLLRQGRARLFDVVLSFERQDYATSFGAARLTEARQLFSGVARYPLAVTLCDFLPGDDPALVIEAARGQVSANEATLIGARLTHVLTALVDNPDLPLGRIDLLPATERELLATIGGDVPARDDAAAPRATVVSTFLDSVRRRPDAPAVLWSGGMMSYAALAAAAGDIALRLRQAGVARGHVVGVQMPPGMPDLVSAMLGVMMAGAAVVPVDPEAPVAYRAARLAELDVAALIVGGGDGEPELTAVCPLVLAVGQRTASPSGAVAVAPEGPVAGDPAYVLFTSGSTGAPKRVVVGHDALLRRLSWLAEHWQVTADDRTGAMVRPGFDPSLIALLMPLIRGGAVALPTAWRMTAGELGDFLAAHKVSIVPLVPATLALVLDATRGRGDIHLRAACCGGEALPRLLADRFICQTGARLTNLYGPTEATIFATAWACMASDAGNGPMPVGLPAGGAVIRLIDRDGDLAALGAVGEICIGGAGLAQGYAGQPALTAARFVPDPVTPGARLYRTGDLGRWGDDGALRFLGRMDRQVKLNGQRIEPGEIEAVLLADPSVRAAVVRVVGEGHSRRLHGWVASEAVDGPALADRLRQNIEKLLPLHMRLAGISVLPELPLMPATAKLDEAALIESLAPLQPPAERRAVTLAAEPETVLERALCDLWSAALGIGHVGVHDDLFALGGDSMAAMTVLAGLRPIAGPDLSLSLLVRHPTVAGQVRAVGMALAHRAVRLAGPAAATSAPIYLAASGHGDALRFRRLADALGACHDVLMLQPPMTDARAADAGAADAAAAEVRRPDFADLAERYGAMIGDAGDARGEAAARHGIAVAGFSIGGLAALETARHLRRSGVSVQRLILIDTTYPVDPARGIAAWRTFAAVVRRLGLHQRGGALWRLISMLEDRGLAWQLQALRQYQPAAYDGPVDLIISSGMRPFAPLLFNRWRRVLTGPLRVHHVEGLHGTLLQPGRVEHLAALLDRLTAGGPAS